MANARNSLVLVRHGQSEFNALNLFTGWKNPPLTKKGEQEAFEAGKRISKLKVEFQYHFTSKLIRAQKTGEIILKELNQIQIKTINNEALNERDYGELSGLNKDESRQKWGKDQVHIWRRSFDVPPPGGESLKDTAARVVPYFEREVLPLLNSNNNVLITAHGNSIRSLIKYIENLTEEEIVEIEVETGMPIIYSRNDQGKMSKLEV